MKKREKNNVAWCNGNCFKWILVVAVILFFLQAIFSVGGFFKEQRGIIGNAFIVCISLITLIASIMMYRKIPENFPREKKAKLFLFISLFFFFIGDLLWLVSEVFFGNFDPVGTAPDLVWNIAYLSLIISLGYFISLSFRPSMKTTVLVILIGIMIGGAILYQDVSEDFEENSFTFAHSIQDAYIVYDVLVLFMVVYLIWPIINLGNRFVIGWFALGFGFITRTVYDRIFADMSQNNTYYTGHPVDLLYVSLYIFILINFYFKSKILGVEQ